MPRARTALALMLVPLAAGAQSFPAKPLRFVVAFVPGSADFRAE